MLGPELGRIAAGEFAERAIVLWAKSLALGAELSPEEWETASELEAAFEAMYLMAAADGELGRDELLLLSQSLEAIIAGAEQKGGARFELSLPLLKLGDVLDRFARALKSEGQSARLEAVARRLLAPESRRLALRLAAGVAFVDDFVAAGEMEALDALASALGFDHQDALAMLREVHQALGAA